MDDVTLELDAILRKSPSTRQKSETKKVHDYCQSDPKKRKEDSFCLRMQREKHFLEEGMKMMSVNLDGGWMKVDNTSGYFNNLFWGEEKTVVRYKFEGILMKPITISRSTTGDCSQAPAFTHQHWKRRKAAARWRKGGLGCAGARADKGRAAAPRLGRGAR